MPESIMDHGAIPNDPNASATNSMAFAAAFAVSPAVSVPFGLAFYTQSISVPVTGLAIIGKAKLIAAGSIPTQSGLVELVNNTGSFSLDGLDISVDSSIYPTIDPIKATGCSNLTIENVVTHGGQTAIYVNGGSQNRIRLCTMSDFTTFGIDGSNVFDMLVYGNSAGGTLGSHRYSFTNCSYLRVRSNMAFTGTGGGIWVRGGQEILVDGNEALNTLLEFFHADSCSVGSFLNNVGLGSGASTDFGMSFSDDMNGPITDFLVASNNIHGSGASGIDLGTGAVRIDVVSNKIMNPCQFKHDAGIALDGSNTQGCVVTGNLIRDSTSKMKWAIREGNISGGGHPSGNAFGTNFGSGTLGQLTQV